MTADPHPLRRDRINGPTIPDAPRGGAGVEFTGTWRDELPATPPATVDGWLDHVLRMAIQEAAHEILEWFHVDDAPWIDARSTHERRTHTIIDALASDLARLRGA